MITQHLIPDFIAKMTGSTEVQKSAGMKKSSSLQFKDTLDLAVEKSYAWQSGTKSYEYAMDIKDRPYQRLQNKNILDSAETKERRPDRTKPFNKASNQITSRASDKAERTASPEEENIEGENDRKLKGKAMEKALAEVLGISVEELEKLMAQLGINFENADGETGIQEAADKISAYLGLNQDEKMALAEMMSLVQKQVEQAFKDVQSAYDAARYDMKDENEAYGVELFHAETETAVEDTSALRNDLDVSKVSQEVKNKLDEETDGFLKQIAAKVVEVVQKDESTAGLKTVSVNGENIEEIGLKTDVEDIGNVREAKYSSDEKDSADNSGNAGSETSSMASRGVEAESAAKNSNNIQFEAVSNLTVQRATGQAEPDKTRNIIPVTNKEIVEQVVEKAKVVLSGDKSEMVIDLKPEHLGKLELKIVTERGMVVAKFVAENEQVKAALESNMNMLKESLEKQGFLVEGFSVTVGDNKRRENSRDKTNQGTANQRISGEKLQVSDMTGVERMQRIHENIDPYSYGSSSIDLTA